MDIRLLRLACLILLPIVVAEFTVRTVHFSDWFDQCFYIARMDQFVSAKQALVLVGSSRVAAAVDESEFEKLFKSRQSDTKVFNMGMGYSTLVEHFFGLKKVSTRRGSLRGFTVLVEAPAGLVDMNDWSGPWASPAAPEILVPYLEPAELCSFWINSSNDAELKSFVTSAKLSSTILRLKQIRRKVTSVLRQKFYAENVAKNLEQSKGLAAAGGIRVDDEGVKLARASAKSAAMSLAAHIGQVDWDRTVACSLAKYVHAQGGEVIFFEIPVSSTFRKPLQSEIRLRDAESFRMHCKSWNSSYLSVPFDCSDADFPDVWHLSSALKSSFTHTLVNRLATMHENLD